ncbi:MAG: flagellar biosynthetic protein FliO, partial [Betaproteobacteria bacterium]
MKRFAPLLGIALALPVALAWPALAIAAADAESVVDAGGMLRGLAGLGVVLALIVFAGWVLKRIGGPQRFGATGPMRIIASQSLGTRERVVLLEVADQWLVIGVAPGNVRSLATMPRGITAAAPAGPQPSFSA